MINSGTSACYCSDMESNCTVETISFTLIILCAQLWLSIYQSLCWKLYKVQLKLSSVRWSEKKAQAQVNPNIWAKNSRSSLCRCTALIALDSSTFDECKNTTLMLYVRTGLHKCGKFSSPSSWASLYSRDHQEVKYMVDWFGPKIIWHNSLDDSKLLFFNNNPQLFFNNNPMKKDLESELSPC